MLSPEFWRAASAKKKKSLQASLVTAKTTAGTVGEFRPGKVFARPVLRGFGVVQLTHLRTSAWEGAGPVLGTLAGVETSKESCLVLLYSLRSSQS